MADVHIVGAGPIGSLAALSALKAGHNVVVSEEHVQAGLPENCSGLFSKDGLTSLKIDYKKMIINKIYGADVFLADQLLEIRKKEPVGFVLCRSSLDNYLANLAEIKGAKIRYNDRIKDKFLSKTIIGADGPHSIVARHFNFPKIPSFAATLQETISYKSDDLSIVQVYLSEKFPGFFGWVIPKNEYFAEFGVGVTLPNNPLNAWNHLLKLKKVASVKPKGWIIPIRTRPKTTYSGKYKVLLAGDAAGQVKSTTGGGVIFGGQCAEIAGRSLNPIQYDLEWNLRFGPDLKIHRLINGYLSSKTDRELSMLGQKLKKLNCDSFLSNFGHMDKPTKMISPNILTHIFRCLNES